MFVLRNRPKGARIRVLRSRSLRLRIDADRDRISGYRVAAGPAAGRRRALAEAGVLRRQQHPARDLQLRPSDRNLFAADRDLSAGQPRQSGHRHHGFGDAQSAGAAAAALSGRRFPQGRPHAEGRPPRRGAAARRDTATPRRRAPATEDPVDIECVREGRQDRRRPRRAGRARAARSGTAGSAERAAACRNTMCRCRSKPSRWTSSKVAPECRAARRTGAAARRFLVQDLEPVLRQLVARLAPKAWSAGSPAKSR